MRSSPTASAAFEASSICSVVIGFSSPVSVACAAQTPAKQSACSSVRTDVPWRPCWFAPLVERAEQILHVVAVLVRDDVALRERAARRPEAGRAARRGSPGRGRRACRPGSRRARRPCSPGRSPSATDRSRSRSSAGSYAAPAPRELVLPEALHGVDVADDAAVLARVRVGTRAAVGEVARSGAGGGLVLQPTELTETSAAAQELQQQQDDEAAEPEAAAAHCDAATGERAAQATAAALVAHLRGVELGVVAKGHRVSVRSWRRDARLLPLGSGRCVRVSEISAEEACRAALERLEAENPRINAVVAWDGERALAEARERDGLPHVWRGPLHGVPFTAKDLTDATPYATTYGSRAFADNVPSADAACIARLRRAGAVLIGKTNTPEMGSRPTTENVLFGATRNPHDTDAHARRLERRGGSGARRGHRHARPGLRWRRLDPHPGGLLRRRRPQADARARQRRARDLRRLGGVRHERPDGAHRRRLRAHARGHGRIRARRCVLPAAPRRRLRRRLRRGSRAAAHRRAARGARGQAGLRARRDLRRGDRDAHAHGAPARGGRAASGRR